MPPGGGGGQSQPSGPMPLEEEDSIKQQTDLLTDEHPGALGSMTPDLPERGRQWHEEVAAKSIEALFLLNQAKYDVSKSLSTLTPSYNDQEKQFMFEVMGKTPEEINSGMVRMNPNQKVMYQRWLGKSVNKSLSGLSNWMKKIV